ncbi:MAG: 2-phosphosulfolactate phosphatase [Candidatus Latescibacteria bacterium]|nr:2-phosphosulfolactate phosphatase [Candidatus Latescibacterota bacterium]
MLIQRLSLWKGLVRARGTVVVIDVFRAFTCEPLLYYYGAEKIYLESDIGKCRKMQGDALLVGEDNERPIEGFDLTNSPSLIMKKGRGFFVGKTVIHRTTSGVAGAVAAMERGDEVFLASFVNARATAACIRESNPALVSIVAMGIRSMEKAPEDENCGDYIQSLLDGSTYDHVGAVSEILGHETAQKFIRGDKPYLPREDPAVCLQRDLFGHALRAVGSGERIMAEKVLPAGAPHGEQGQK